LLRKRLIRAANKLEVLEIGDGDMAKFLRSICVPEQAISADGVVSFDLAVNPLSCVMLGLRPLNNTGTLANYASYVAIASAVNRATIYYLGQSIFSMRGEDIAALNWLRHGIYPWEANPDNVDDAQRCVVLPMFLGKHMYDRKSCFPATRRGELILELDLDIADTGYDGLRLSVDTLELLGASPSEYEKKLSVYQTFAATGTNDVDLYTGNKCRGILLFGTTGYAGAAPAPTWGRIKVLLDNIEQGFHAIDWEMAIPDSALIAGRQPAMGQHKHTVPGAGLGVEESTSVFDIDQNFTQYNYLDYDPTRDDEFILETRGSTRFQIRAEAEAANAVRAIQIEVLSTNGVGIKAPSA